MSMETYGGLAVLDRPAEPADAWAAEFDPERGALEALWKLPAIEPAAPEQPESDGEVYAQSLRTIHELGRLAVANQLNTPEGEAAEAMLHREFVRGIAEMLNTDKEFRAELDIEPEDSYEIREGKVVTQDGTPVVDMVRRGRDASRRAAEHDPRMHMQAYRDQADLENAEAVDRLLPGQLRVVLSMDPKEVMEGPDAKFWEDNLGYRKGMAFLQWYYKVDEKTMKVGSPSVGLSDPQIWSTIFAKHGNDVLPDTLSGDWIRHPFERTVGNVDEARKFVRGLRTDYYKNIGAEQQRLSVTELIARNQQLVDTTFAQIYRELARAEYSHQKNGTIHLLARGLVHSASMRAEIRGQLRRICASGEFDAAAARTMDFVVRYGIVEQLRPSLKALLQPGTIDVPVVGTEPGYNYVLPHVGAAYNQATLVGGLVGSVLTGVAAGRSYGGCAPVTLSSSEKTLEGLNDPLNPQLAYGGLEQKEEKSEQANIPKTIRCIKCAKPSPREQVVRPDSWRCPHCKYEVDVCTGAQLHPSQTPGPAPRKSLLTLGA